MPLNLSSNPVTCHAMCQVFEVFDTKKNDVIGFDEFVKAVSVFHPNAPLQEKADCESTRLLHAYTSY